MTATLSLITTEAYHREKESVKKWQYSHAIPSLDGVIASYPWIDWPWRDILYAE